MRKFKIPKNPSSTNKSVRFPNDLIEEVETAIRGTDCTFSAFVVEAVRVALDNLREDEDGGT
ncbi:YlcI/YnfO family protein [uncultured Oscillibacter sp.]|uniref:YlcI/YnfO family protein n=1 Tax=uncultured Oscillibacter sp. TaxID=876091 RepID=UPI0025F8956A|nr:YlcI/YnfO family protein [uncultured Oscillibacter sp.]